MGQQRDHRAILLAVVFVSLFVSVSAFAADQSCGEPVVNLSELLLAPPKPGSLETGAELRELQRLQKSRTAKTANHARADHQRTIERFLDPIGIKLHDLPSSTADFFKCVARLTEQKVQEAKITFKRSRPYTLPHNRLHVLKTIGKDDSFSYPSGHAAYGMVTGLILSAMLPEKRDAIQRRIEDFGYSRLVSGVHFRSDVYAGQISGAAVAAAFFENATFRDAFQKAKVDLRTAASYQL
jgi:acid phosphatase (class A)